MFNAQGKLDIFENFRTDWNLPKHRKDDEDENLVSSKGNVKSLRRRNVIDMSEDSVSWGVTESDGNFLVTNVVGQKPGFFARVAAVFTRKTAPKPTLSIEQFFESVKNSAEELEVVGHRIGGYETALKKAQERGQTALFEELSRGVAAVRAETQLVALGQTKYLTEEKLVEFVKKCPKGLRLDWLANFTRVIPDSVIEGKTKADERHVFDNYVVLHFDPEAKSWAETEAEKAERIRRKRDPILFGVLRGRRRLYYVGDWVDEFCDLTLDKIADTIGADSIQHIPKDVSETLED